MTKAAKMIEDWQYNGAGFYVGQKDLLDIIQQVTERTRKECERASTFVLAAHPRWSNLVADAIDRAIWEDDEYTPD